MNLENITLSDKSITKRQILYDSTYRSYLAETTKQNKQKTQWQFPGATVKDNRELFSRYTDSVFQYEEF